MEILKTSGNLIKDIGAYTGKVEVRKAIPKDCLDVFHIASSVGKSRKISEEGFLIDDYASNPKYYQSKLLKNISYLS